MEQITARPIEFERFLDPGFLNLDEVLDALELEIGPSSGLFVKQGLELRRCPPERRKVAIAISGGGASGAYNAGLLEVLLGGLRRRGIEVGILVGTSSGAVNGYGVFLEALGLGNPQFRTDPSIRQPFDSYIASAWSYLDRDGKASRWVVGQRSWIVRLASRGFPTGGRKLGIALLLVAVATLLQPNLLLPLASLAARAGADSLGWIASDSLAQSVPFLFGLALAATAALSVGGWLVAKAFRESLFPDLPLLRFLANTGPDGDLRRYPRLSRGQAIDRARNLSRDIVAEWYRRRDEVPEFIITGTDISAGRECLFTLVRPETYKLLLRREWMAVQFDSAPACSTDYDCGARAMFAPPETFLRSLVASSAVPGAFPTQRIGIYRAGGNQVARHHFVDGGVLNNSPVHVAIDAGATHVISLEIRPFEQKDPLASDARPSGGYGLLGAALATFTTVLERATREDIRRTASWNRFLMSRPAGLGPGRGSAGRAAPQRRVVPIYRVAPRAPLVGTVEFDGRFEEGKRTVTLRDLLHRGVLDMRGRNVWPATVRHRPGWTDPVREDPSRDGAG